MMRILHICESFDPGGVVWWLLDVLKLAPPDEFQFDFYALGKTLGLRAQEVIQKGSHLTLFQATPKEVFLGNQIRQILRMKKYDIVHAHIFNLSGWLLRHAHSEGVPIRIVHYHNTNDGRPENLINQIRRYVSRLVASRYANVKLACSQSAMKKSPSLHTELLAQVLYYGVDSQRFMNPPRVVDLRYQLGLSSDTKLVVHIGRFYPQKNHIGLVEIFAHVLKRDPNAHLVLIGDGPLMPQIRTRVIELGIASHVWFMGARTDVAELLPTMNVFAFPSLYEGMGIAVVEARMAGLPIVASNLPSIAEAVEGSDGYALVKPDQHQQFAWELIKFLNLNKRIMPPSEWIARFDRQASANILFDIYRRLNRTISRNP